MREIIDELGSSLPGPEKGFYDLRLYVSGCTPLSSRAIANIKAICESRLKGRYELKVIDLYQEPNLAQSQQILVTPTLVKHYPLPLCRLVGDLSNTQRVLLALGVQPDP